MGRKFDYIAMFHPDISFHHTPGSVIVITRDRGMSGIDTSKVEDGKI
jgi:hypothetical protein